LPYAERVSRSGPVPLATQTPIRGLWLCFWLIALGVVAWAAVGPLPSTGQRVLLFAVLATVPVRFFFRRLALWVGRVGQRVSTPKDLGAVARWRLAVVVFSALNLLANGAAVANPLSFRVGLALSGLATLACAWRFGAVMLAVQTTGTPEPSPAAPRVASVLPGWTWTVRAAQVGQLIVLLCTDPSFSAGGLFSTLLISAGTAGTLELLLRFVQSRAGVEFR